jgi:UDP:flavonoid glycosyltransferase YjiC (YdhE family)
MMFYVLGVESFRKGLKIPGPLFCLNLPGNVHTEPFIPFGNLLPYIDLLITNGGFGGTQNALAYGIPIIIAGATEDKMEVAARLEYSGAGINLRNQKPTSKNILKAYRKIMSDHSYKQKAKELKEHYAKFDAPDLAIGMIEELIKNKQTSGQINRNDHRPEFK